MFVVVAIVAIFKPADLLVDASSNSEHKIRTDNVYVWNGNLREFISPGNVSLPAIGSELSALPEENTVRLLVHEMYPYTIVPDHSSEEVGGYLGDIWMTVRDFFNFKATINVIDYDTALNLIQNGQSDLLLGAVVYKKGLQNIRYSQPYFQNWYKLYIRQPEARATSSSYLKTFTPQLWFAAAAAFITLTGTLWSSSKFLSKAFKLEQSFSVPTCFLGVVSGFINQGFDLHLRSMSCRCQQLAAMLFGGVLYAGINAVLVAQLSIFVIPSPYNSIEDVATLGKYGMCLRTNSFVYNYFIDNTTREPLPRWKDILNARGCGDIHNQENIGNICNKSLIMFENRVIMAVVSPNLPCEITSFGDTYFKTPNFLLVRKGFRGSKHIAILMTKMRSTGVLLRLQNKWVPPRRPEEPSTNSHQITFDHVGGLICMYFIATCTSLIILTLEIVYFKYFDRKDVENEIEFTK